MEFERSHKWKTDRRGLFWWHSSDKVQLKQWPFWWHSSVQPKQEIIIRNVCMKFEIT